MADRKAYLAEKYMSGIKAEAILSRAAPQKKKKRKVNPTTATRAIVVDEDGGWGDEGKEDLNELEEAVVEKDRGFKKRRTAATGESGSGWATVQEGYGATKEESPSPDEQPVVVGDPSFVGGLVTSEQLRKVLPKPKVTEITPDEVAVAQETIYRDATGQKIDTKAERAAAARRKREQEELEAQKMEWGKGLVQKEEKEKERRELERLQGKDFTRYADDADLNEELKSKMLWNDPAAAFLTKKTSKGPRKPEYMGPPPPPNRYGIKPGYRWDGVDRGNGFEKKLFQTSNERKRRGLESYQWSVDDM